jgi:hypothetical protein
MNTRHEQQCDDHQTTIQHIEYQTTIQHIEYQTPIKKWRGREKRRNIPKLQWQLWQWTTYNYVSHTREATPPNTKFEHHFLTPNPKLKPHFLKSYTLTNFKLPTFRSLKTNMWLTSHLPFNLNIQLGIKDACNFWIVIEIHCLWVMVMIQKEASH